MATYTARRFRPLARHPTTPLARFRSTPTSRFRMRCASFSGRNEFLNPGAPDELRLVMEEIKPRFEFRIWRDNCQRERELLGALTRPGTGNTSRETYLISSAAHRSNLKIRSGLMDIKVLDRTERGLELWKPVLKAEFPLDATTITTAIYPRLELEPPAVSPGPFPEASFLELMSRDARIAIVPVSKDRSQFEIGSCTAECASVIIDGQHDETVAAESTDPDALLALLEQIGISNLSNQSYVREIKRVIDARTV